MLKSAIDGIKLITNSERLVYVLWFASGLPGLSVRRCLSISRVAYMWNPTVSRGSTDCAVLNHSHIVSTKQAGSFYVDAQTLHHVSYCNSLFDTSLHGAELGTIG